MPTSAKWAFVTKPHVGGIYSVYRALRAGRSRRGIDLRWLGIGADAAREPPEVWPPESTDPAARLGNSLTRHDRFR